MNRRDKEKWIRKQERFLGWRYPQVPKAKRERWARNFVNGALKR